MRILEFTTSFRAKLVVMAEHVVSITGKTDHAENGRREFCVVGLISGERHEVMENIYSVVQKVWGEQ